MSSDSLRSLLSNFLQSISGSTQAAFSFSAQELSEAENQVFWGVEAAENIVVSVVQPWASPIGGDFLLFENV